MTHLSAAFENAIGQAILNGDTSATNNPIFSNLGISQALNSIPLYGALHIGDPGQTGANEVTTSNYVGYLRPSVARSKAISSGSTSIWVPTTSASVFFTNTNGAIQFVACGVGSTGSPDHFSLWDSSSAGNMIAYGPLIASGSVWRVGLVTDATPTSTVYSRSHGLSGGETIIMYSLYDGWLATVAGATSGVTTMVASIVDADTFTVAASFATNTFGGFAWNIATTIALADGKVPNIPAGGAIIRFT